jgi:hypothetical protein
MDQAKHVPRTGRAMSTTHDGGANVRWRSPGRWRLSVAPYVPAASVPALGLALLALAGRGPRSLGRKRSLAGVLAVGAALALVRWQLGRFFTSQPDYEVERIVGGVEIRRYGPRAVAETTADAADWDTALGEGFRRLAGYIFGGNEKKQRIAMTSPVTASRAGGATSERLAMTAPVTSRVEAGGYTVTFTMPKDRELASLPVPRDPRIRLREVPGERVAVLRYHGRYRGDLARAKQTELLERVRAAGLEPRGEPSFAGYDAPWTLPFLRRLEAWLPIA